jgi:hypothetical protein
MMISLLLTHADIMISLLLMFTCQCYYQSPVVKMSSLVLLHLDDPTNDTLWQYCHVVPTPSTN